MDMSKEKSQRRLNKCLADLKARTGFDDVQSFMNRQCDRNKEYDEELEMLADQIVRRTAEIERMSKEYPLKRNELSRKLENATRIKEMVEWSLVNLSDRIKEKRIECSDDIGQFFKETDSNELLTYNLFSIDQCAVDAYLE